MARAVPAEPYKGVEYATVHPLIGNLCSRPEGGTDVAMYRALHTWASIEDAMRMAEIQEVGRSWRDAYQANAELEHAKG